ncbi:zinc finger MYM-type protein 1-like [Galendromus occidentalis]|uniref:Zinc finger MYM-type protein 1-like n=1 Tax=Galendromus occidentalis TaxID=34638 RepID=A0AAJ6QQD2_9ACAR|nr:zinc finger MYM-type protein 1-like [Galendromus occidentalis]
MLVILDRVLGIVNSLSEYLQSSKIEFTRAAELSRATIVSLSSIRSNEAFDLLWDEAETVARAASVDLPEDGEPKPKRRRILSKHLQDSVVMSSVGSREESSGSDYDGHRITFYGIIDRFSAEIERRLIGKDNILELLQSSDPRRDDFLDENNVRLFFRKFSRFNVDVEKIIGQLVVARDLLKGRKFETTLECLEFLLPLKAGFDELVMYFKMVLAFPVTSASCERSFSALRRIKSYLRSSMGDQRLSALALLSIERDLTESLLENPDQIVDGFAIGKDRRIPLMA